MQITFMGTSSMVPTKERNQIGVFVRIGSEGILLDCGEGTQRQFKIAGASITDITKILISHWHGDHTLGLPGLIQSLSASEYGRTLEIYGPKGTEKRIEKLFEAFVFDRKIELKVKDIAKELFFENENLMLEAVRMEHGIETLGFSVIEKGKRKINLEAVKKLKIPTGPLLGQLQGNKAITLNGKKITPEQATYLERNKKLAYITDTTLCGNCYKMAEGADLLICESTYSSKLVDKSEKYGHLTAKQAGLIASKANAKKLVLVHFSARYKSTQELEEDAREVFDNSTCAYDFMKLGI